MGLEHEPDAHNLAQCGRALRSVLGAAAAVALLLTTGCASSDSFSLPKIDDINPFLKKDPPLAGKRVPIMEATGSIANTLAAADRPILLPAQVAVDNWPQPGGNASNVPGHAAFSATPKQAWSADAGSGSHKQGKVTAPPIVYDGRVYTLDAAARVSAFAVNGGSTVWRTSMVPDSERKAGSMFTISGSSSGGGYGGGLAAEGGRLFVATGYGTVSALDPKTGKVLWTKSLGAPVRAAPTAVVDRVVVISADGRATALSANDGSELWSAKGVAEQASLMGSPSPAIEGNLVVVPFPSGELLGLKLTDGEQIWNEGLSTTKGASAMGALSDAARPAIEGGVVFAAAHGGRTTALQARTGERIWSAAVASTQGPVVAGDNVFVAGANGQLVALNRRTGQTLWTAKLPDSNVWSGPVLAGGQLWLVSGRGAMVGVDGATGRIVTQVSLGAPAYVPPIVAGGRLYVLTDNARLIAFN